MLKKYCLQRHCQKNIKRSNGIHLATFREKISNLNFQRCSQNQNIYWMTGCANTPIELCKSDLHKMIDFISMIFFKVGVLERVVIG